MSLFIRNFRKTPIVLYIDTVQRVLYAPTSNWFYKRPFVHCYNCRPSRCFHLSTVVSKKRMKEIKEQQKEIEYVSPRKRKPVIGVWDGMTIEDLGKAMGKDANHVFELMEFVDNTSHYRSPSDVLDGDVLNGIVSKARLRIKLQPPESKSYTAADRDVYPSPPAPEEKLVRRPPVVTIMGHVDHGKTTLLDYLRKSSIVDSEFGGITQHIGAFSVKIKSQAVTFLDTPGHAAFKAMRSRGAHCTDIVVLVVAADDGVMEQTEESIKMAKEAKVPIIVAINKIDKHNADIELTKRMLAAQSLIPEEMGGNVQVVPISALKGTNVEQLVEAILVQAEISNLRSDPDGHVEGVVLESRMHPHIGKLSTALVRRGTMRKGAILTAGEAWCKVRIMLNDQQKMVDKATPSVAVEVAGWKSIPLPGDIILEVKSEKQAQEVVECRKKKSEFEKAVSSLPEIQLKQKKHNEQYKKKLREKRKCGYIYTLPEGPKQKEIIETYSGPLLNIVVKADVEGSLEALLDSLNTYHSTLCKLDVVHYGIGPVLISDVEIAELFDAVIYNFNTSVSPEATRILAEKSVAIRPQNIIYRFLEDVRNEMNSRLPEKEMEEVIAEAEVLKMFLIMDGKKKNIPVAGCRCTKGELKKTFDFRLLRNGVEIHRGKLYSMRNLKVEVNTIKKEQECGLRFEDSSVLFEPGDIIQAIRTYTVPQEIDWNPYGLNK